MHCDWFVEKKLLQERVAGLTRQLNERDVLDQKIEVRRRRGLP